MSLCACVYIWARTKGWMINIWRLFTATTILRFTLCFTSFGRRQSTKTSEAIFRRSRLIATFASGSWIFMNKFWKILVSQRIINKCMRNHLSLWIIGGNNLRRLGLKSLAGCCRYFAVINHYFCCNSTLEG